MNRIVPEKSNPNNQLPSWIKPEELIQAGRTSQPNQITKEASVDQIVTSYACSSCGKIVNASSDIIKSQMTTQKYAGKSTFDFSCPKCSGILSPYKTVGQVSSIDNAYASQVEVKRDLEKESSTYNTYVDRHLVYKAIDSLQNYAHKMGMFGARVRYLNSEHTKQAGQAYPMLNNINCEIEWMYGRNQKAKVEASIEIDQAGKYKFPRVFKFGSVEYPFEKESVQKMQKEVRFDQLGTPPQKSSTPTFKKPDVSRFRQASLKKKADGETIVTASIGIVPDYKTGVELEDLAEYSDDIPDNIKSKYLREFNRCFSSLTSKYGTYEIQKIFIADVGDYGDIDEPVSGIGFNVKITTTNEILDKLGLVPGGDYEGDFKEWFVDDLVEDLTEISNYIFVKCYSNFTQSSLRKKAYTNNAVPVQRDITQFTQGQKVDALGKPYNIKTVTPGQGVTLSDPQTGQETVMSEENAKYLQPTAAMQAVNDIVYGIKKKADQRDYNKIQSLVDSNLDSKVTKYGPSIRIKSLETAFENSGLFYPGMTDEEYASAMFNFIYTDSSGKLNPEIINELHKPRSDYRERSEEETNKYRNELGDYLDSIRRSSLKKKADDDDYEVSPGFYEDDEGYVKFTTREGFQEWLDFSGFETEETLKEETGFGYDDLRNGWFIVQHNRIYDKESSLKKRANDFSTVKKKLFNIFKDAFGVDEFPEDLWQSLGNATTVEDLYRIAEGEGIDLDDSHWNGWETFSSLKKKADIGFSPQKPQKDETGHDKYHNIPFSEDRDITVGVDEFPVDEKKETSSGHPNDPKKQKGYRIPFKEMDENQVKNRERFNNQDLLHLRSTPVRELDIYKKELEKEAVLNLVGLRKKADDDLEDYEQDVTYKDYKKAPPGFPEPPTIEKSQGGVSEMITKFKNLQEDIKTLQASIDEKKKPFLEEQKKFQERMNTSLSPLTEDLKSQQNLLQKYFGRLWKRLDDAKDKIVWYENSIIGNWEQSKVEAKPASLAEILKKAEEVEPELVQSIEKIKALIENERTNNIISKVLVEYPVSKVQEPKLKASMDEEFASWFDEATDALDSLEDVLLTM